MRGTFRTKIFLSFLTLLTLSIGSAWLITRSSPISIGTFAGLWLIGAAAAWFLSGGLSLDHSRSLKEMASAAAEWFPGETGHQAKKSGPGDAGELGAALNRMTSSLTEKFRGLREEHSRLAAILSSMREGVLVLDRAGSIVLVNSALADMFSLVEEKVRGRSYPEVLRHHPLTDLIKTVLETRDSLTREIIIQSPRERTFQIQASVTGGGHAVFVFHDITALKNLERVRKDFVANVSHEIRTPLTSIMGYIEALQDGGKDDPEKSKEFFAIIKKHTAHLNAILSDLLELSSIESGEYLWKKESVSIGDVVEEAVRLVRPVSDKKKQSLNTGAVESGFRVSGDKSKLIEVFSNLLDNAVKYTPEGGKISIENREENGRVETDIVDSGIGIPEKNIPRLFERFYRVDTARSREMGGTGLGLAIVKHIVEAHGGSVSVKSRPEKGSRFRVSLPKES